MKSFGSSFSNPLDTSLHQYNEISLMKRPMDSQVKSLCEWIESPHLGGGCGFLGRDLGGFAQEAAYDPKYAGDLVMLSEQLGEDDLLTRFISGPLLRLFHTFWQRYKVRDIFNSRSYVQVTDLLYAETCSPRPGNPIRTWK
jgi:hypothetical protein